MAETPSKRRRKGREAFCPGGNPMDFQPYKVGSWGYDFYLKDFLDGWEEAEKQYNIDSEEYDEEFDICPCCGRRND